MDKIQKALQKLRSGERAAVKKILGLLIAGKFAGLDIQKLKGRDDIYRVRKSSIRIIYRVAATGEIFILAIERRSDTAYNL